MALDASTIAYIDQLIISLIGAGFGAVVGAYFGLKLARNWDREKKKEEESEIKNRVLDAIIEELKSFQPMVEPQSKKFAKLDWNSNDRDFTGIYITISTPAFQSAVNSGNFSLLPPLLQTELGQVYITLDECKLLNDQAENFYATGIFASNPSNTLNREANRICSTFNNKIADLRGELNKVIPKLESAKEIPKQKKFAMREDKTNQSETTR